MAEHGLRKSLRQPQLPSVATEQGLTFGLLLALLLSAITGMTAALQGPDLAVLWLGLLSGLLLGWALALLRQPATRTAVVVLLTGVLFLLLVPGDLGGKILSLIVESIHRLFASIPFYPGQAIDPGRLGQLAQALGAAAQILAERSWVWIAALASDQPVFDPVAAALAWNALVWVVSAWAGWIVEARRNALLAAFPALLLSLATLASGQRTPASLFLMLGLVLLLLAVSRQDQRKREWEAEHLAYPSHKGRQILGAALAVTVGLVLLSALIPSLSVQRLRQWIDTLRQPAPQQQSRLAESLGILPGGTPVPDHFQAVRSPGLPREHLIGSGPELSQQVVMTVKVADLTALFSGGQPLPLYWRGFTYDIYTGHGWSSSATAEATVAANQSLQADQGRGYLLIRQEVSPVEDLGGTIYAAGEPVRLNLSSQAAWRGAGDLFGVRIDSSAAYEVLSLVPVVDGQVLRSAGERYPDWIRQRYLSLPDELPEQVKALALRLTAFQPTPFDRATAIESYLRTFPYTLDVPRPPQDRDVVDYFLFDLQKGYCDYFASAMVVLARAAGIPARLAIGYAPGTYNLNSGHFVVTEADAHSWAELYFSGIGWVPFDATPSHSTLVRSAPLAAQTPSSGNSPAQPARPEEKASLPWAWFLAGLIALATLLTAGWNGLDGYRLRRLPFPAAELYRRLGRAGKRLAVISKPGDTPYEFSAALQNRLAELAARVNEGSF